MAAGAAATFPDLFPVNSRVLVIENEFTDDTIEGTDEVYKCVCGSLVFYVDTFMHPHPFAVHPNCMPLTPIHRVPCPPPLPVCLVLVLPLLCHETA